MKNQSQLPIYVLNVLQVSFGQLSAFLIDVIHYYYFSSSYPSPQSFIDVHELIGTQAASVADGIRLWLQSKTACGNSMSEKAPQEHSDEETEVMTEAMPAKSVRRSGNQRLHIDTSKQTQFF